jgi:hypothetical protein
MKLQDFNNECEPLESKSQRLAFWKSRFLISASIFLLLGLLVSGVSYLSHLPSEIVGTDYQSALIEDIANSSQATGRLPPETIFAFWALALIVLGGMVIGVMHQSIEAVSTVTLFGLIVYICIILTFQKSDDVLFESLNQLETNYLKAQRLYASGEIDRLKALAPELVLQEDEKIPKTISLENLYVIEMAAFGLPVSKFTTRLQVEQTEFIEALEPYEFWAKSISLIMLIIGVLLSITQRVVGQRVDI